jgi:hypothetical protein
VCRRLACRLVHENCAAGSGDVLPRFSERHPTNHSCCILSHPQRSWRTRGRRTYIRRSAPLVERHCDASLIGQHLQHIPPMQPSRELHDDIAFRIKNNSCSYLGICLRTGSRPKSFHEDKFHHGLDRTDGPHPRIGGVSKVHRDPEENTGCV